MGIVNQCDRCQKIPTRTTLIRWVSIRYSDGDLANFIDLRNKESVLCFECWKLFLEFKDKRELTLEEYTNAFEKWEKSLGRSATDEECLKFGLYYENTGIIKPC